MHRRFKAEGGVGGDGTGLAMGEGNGGGVARIGEGLKLRPR